MLRIEVLDGLRSGFYNKGYACHIVSGKERKESRKEMLKRVRKLFPVTVLAMVFAVGTAFAAWAGDDTFVSGTSYNGLGIGGLTVDEAAEQIKGFYSKEYKLTINERNGAKEFIEGTEIGFTVAVPDGVLQGILDGQNAGGRIFGPDVDNRHRGEMQNNYNAELLAAKVNSLNCISGSGIVTTADASISGYQEGQPFVIIPEVRGTSVYPERVLAAIRQAVAAGIQEVDLDIAGCYHEIQVTSEDAGLKAICDTMNQCREMTVTYVFGEQQEVLAAETICSWITGSQNGQIMVNNDAVAAYVRSLATKYNTAGTIRTFHTATGREVSLTGPYGWEINQEAETAALTAAIQTGQSQSREPVYSLAAVNHTSQEWGNTYVEVDISGQHVYLIKEGEVVWDASCVTGNLARNHDTPSGIYSLNYKERNKVLRGARQADGTYEYESPVSYWMPFNGGIGLHDANWRSNFGGAIYEKSGSHGCVNLPSSKTAALYEAVYSGIPVICYLNESK